MRKEMKRVSMLEPRLVFLLWAILTVALTGQDAAQPAPQPASPPQVYRLAAGDTIEIRHAFNPELNEQAQIRPDGRLSLPLIGEIEVAGRTIQEVVSLLEERYIKEVRAPRITLQVRGFAGQKIFVTGEVVRPGVIGLPGPMTLFEALNEAGGLKLTGSKTNVLLIRKASNGQAEGRKVSPYVRGRLSADASLPLQPFDVVIVHETAIAHVDRWIDQHIRQLIPVSASAGFTYLFQHQPGGIPIF
jgi:polysaccharide export outer membrane protein